MGVKVTVDKTGFDAVFLKMKQINQLDLTVGVQGKKGAKIVTGSGTNMASVALFNEFGTKNIPQRSFIRGALFANRDDINAKIAEVMERYIARPSMTALAALSEIGRFVAKLVRTRINTTSHWARPNAPSTVAAKGFNRPLHSVGFGGPLSRSISWAVRGPGGSIISEGAAR